MYSFAPTLRILNGELQAINGLRDAAVLGRSRRALRLVRSGDRAARAALGGFDTGAWSLYSAAGAESTLSYHQLTTHFLGELCNRTGRDEYCRAQRRFARYEHEPPRIGIAPARGLWARRAAPLRFTLSKGSDVRVRVFGPRGLVLARDLRLERGGHDLSLDPAVARPLPAAGAGARAGGEAGPLGPDGAGGAAEAEAEEEAEAGRAAPARPARRGRVRRRRSPLSGGRLRRHWSPCNAGYVNCGIERERGVPRRSRGAP